MSITEITGIERLETDGGGSLRGYSIELPISGSVKNSYAFELGGWVLAQESRVTQVELIANDGPVRRIPIVFPRADVAQAFPGTPEGTKVGFWAPISVIGMTPEFALLIQAVLDDGRRTPIARVLGRHRALPSHFHSSMRPLLINSLARMGTTWVMRLLSEHPAIATLRIYPYEVRPARYWMQLIGAMAEPANQAQSSSKLGIVPEEWWGDQDPMQRGSLDRNPVFQQWFNTYFVEQVAQVCQQNIENCYREIAASQNQPPPQYFAEKHIPDEVPGIAWELYPGTREIFVVRDFRDMLCSIRAFNAKRGTLGFNRDMVASEEEYIHRLGREARQLLSGWRSRRERTLLIRYEDLILRPAETLQQIFTYLDLESGELAIEGLISRASVDTPELAGHRTSGNAAASIGRWKTDLDSQSLTLSEEVFGEALREFGYEKPLYDQ